MFKPRMDTKMRWMFQQVLEWNLTERCMATCRALSRNGRTRVAVYGG